MLLRNPKVCLTEHDGYPFDRVVIRNCLRFSWDLVGASLVGGVPEMGAEKVIGVVGMMVGWGLGGGLGVRQASTPCLRSGA